MITLIPRYMMISITANSIQKVRRKDNMVTYKIIAGKYELQRILIITSIRSALSVCNICTTSFLYREDIL